MGKIRQNWGLDTTPGSPTEGECAPLCCGCVDTVCYCEEINFRVERNFGGIPPRDQTDYYPNCCDTWTPCYTWDDPPVELTAQLEAGDFLRYEIWADGVLESESNGCADPPVTPQPNRTECAKLYLMGTRDNPVETTRCGCIAGFIHGSSVDITCTGTALGIVPPRDTWTIEQQEFCCWRWQNFMLIAYRVPVSGPPVELARCRAKLYPGSPGTTCPVVQESLGDGCPDPTLIPGSVDITIDNEPFGTASGTLGDPAGFICNPCGGYYGTSPGYGGHPANITCCFNPASELWEVSYILDVEGDEQCSFLAYGGGCGGGPEGVYEIDILTYVPGSIPCWEGDDPLPIVTITTTP